MIIKRLKELGYEYEPVPLEILTFHSATKVGNLIFTSGQVPILGDNMIKGKVGKDIDISTAKKAAEICAFNCLRAAGAVVDVESIKRVIKVSGMVNATNDFEELSEVINGCSEFIQKIFLENKGHSRTAIGASLPANFSVEVDMIFSIE